MVRTWCILASLSVYAGVARAQEPAAPPPPAGEQPAAETPPAPPEAPPAEPPPPPPPETWLEGWKGTVELGLSGSSGTTEESNFRAGFGAKRTTEKHETSVDFFYKFSSREGDTSDNKARLDVRNDWLFKDSRWRLFALGFGEYDDFQEWEFRVGVFGGVGYEFIKNDRTQLIGRAGVGVSKEIGGPDEDLVPEAVLGVDLDHKIDDRQKFTFNFDFYPDLGELGPYRFVGKAAYEFLVDPKTKMTLKLGVLDTYDSTPGDGFRRNDFDYFAVLVWSF